jgi:putative toxin-antitoxin system antitoxin component (TIGR02293 family)
MPSEVVHSPYHAGLLALSFLRKEEEKIHGAVRRKHHLSIQRSQYLKYVRNLSVSHSLQQMDVVEALQAGLSGGVVAMIETILGVNTKELSQVLDREDKTVRGWARREHLDQTASEKLFRLLKGFTAAYLVFEDEAQADGYLREESVALGGKKPLDLLATGEGEALVLNELAQIEYGHPV